MKIKNLQISNILSFCYYPNISDAPMLNFDEKLSILIGENGSGKSTVLEVLNFIFKRVFFRQCVIKQDFFIRRALLSLEEKRRLYSIVDNRTWTGFRLDPNFDFEDDPQQIKIEIELDDIDFQNILNLKASREKLEKVASEYSHYSIPTFSNVNKNYVVVVNLSKINNSFSVDITPSDDGYTYLTNYNLFKEVINNFNENSEVDKVDMLYESLVLIGGYRNYSTFNPVVSLNISPTQQIQQIKDGEFARSLNSSEQTEPLIFNNVRLNIAEKHFNLFGSNLDAKQCEVSVNNDPVLVSINKRLRLINLECKLKLLDQHTWQYAFDFFDLKRNRPISNINNLSAGQKAITHLIFEAYGKGDLKGGLIIIDEPEIHLHYQFQTEYLNIIKEINTVQNCQYVLATHSDSLINSETIENVKRFTLDSGYYSTIKSPSITVDQKTLIKILDNTRSTYAFFGRKVLLVEGDSDRYFFKAYFNGLNLSRDQGLSVLDIGGKGSYEKWKIFFESFGLSVYYICDLDAAFNFFYPSEKSYKLDSKGAIDGFRCIHSDIDAKIESEYLNNIFILKNGDLEDYLNISPKGLVQTIKFCDTSLNNYLNGHSIYENEIREITRLIVDEI